MSLEYLFDASGRLLTAMHASPHTIDRHELYAGGWHLGTYVSGTTYMNHADWLGTVRVRTGPTGTVFSGESFTSRPFGDALSSVGAIPAHFTDQDRDTESGLDHFLFRQYSSTQGRWMTPDPAGMAAVDPSNPQTWNRYAYVNGNPLNSVDPDGRCPIEYSEHCNDPTTGAGGDSGPTFIVDGIETHNMGSYFEHMLSRGIGFALCPDNSCTRVHNGIIQQFTAFANGAGYYNINGPGAIYYSSDAAGLAGAKYGRKLAGTDNVEVAGTVVKDANGIFSYGNIQRHTCGFLDGCVWDVNLSVADTDHLVGYFHTHPPGGNNNFSNSPDLDALTSRAPLIYGYLSSPIVGRFVEFDPARFLSNGRNGSQCVMQGDLIGLKHC